MTKRRTRKPGLASARKRSTKSAPRHGKTPTEATAAAATVARLKRRLAAARRRVARLEARADTDFLLDIPNRRGFERELKRSIAYVRRYRATAALLLVDVD